MLLGLVFLQLAGSASSRPLPEYEVKAAFLYNFTNFVTWPEDVLAEQETFPVCVLGQDPFGEVLDETFLHKTYHGIPMEVRRVALHESASCRVLFISPSEEWRLAVILHLLQGLPILTVSELHEFIDRGGMINLSVQQNQIRFSINAAAAEQAGLKISSQLLKLARRVILGQRDIPR